MGRTRVGPSRIRNCLVVTTPGVDTPVAPTRPLDKGLGRVSRRDTRVDETRTVVGSPVHSLDPPSTPFTPLGVFPNWGVPISPREIH